MRRVHDYREGKGESSSLHDYKSRCRVSAGHVTSCLFLLCPEARSGKTLACNYILIYIIMRCYPIMSDVAREVEQRRTSTWRGTARSAQEYFPLAVGSADL